MKTIHCMLIDQLYMCQIAYIDFLSLLGCPACFFNMTVDIMNPSRKCFAVDLSWRTYGVIDTFVTVVYYNVTLLSSSKSGVAAFNNRIDDPNITSFKISSDLLESRTEYIVILETHLLLDETQFSLQRNTSIKTPSCTGKYISNH